VSGRIKIIISILILVITTSMTTVSHSKSPARAKFYDFSEQLIDGEIKKPTSLYVGTREKVKFNRLMRLKKSFIPQLFKTAKESVFR